MSVLSQSQNQDRCTPLPLHMQLGRRTPDMRNTGSTVGTVGPAPSIKDLAECRSRLSSRQGEEGMGRFSAMSRQDSIGSSLSGWSGAQGGSNFAVVTPPCAPDAFQAHELLVKCPAPKRPMAFSRGNAPFSRPLPSVDLMNQGLPLSGPLQGLPLARPRGVWARAPSRSSLSMLEAARTADDLVAMRRNRSSVSLQRIPSELTMQRVPSSLEVTSAEDLAQCALHFGRLTPA